MQNYFREQRDNIKTINLVSETCVFLQSFYVDVVTKENIELNVHNDDDIATMPLPHTSQ